MGEDGINFTGVTVLLNSNTNDTCMKVRMVSNDTCMKVRMVSNDTCTKVRMVSNDTCTEPNNYEMAHAPLWMQLLEDACVTSWSIHNQRLHSSLASVDYSRTVSPTGHVICLFCVNMMYFCNSFSCTCILNCCCYYTLIGHLH